MKVLLTGARGQLGMDLQKSCPPGVALVALGRDGLDITDTGSVATVMAEANPDVVINAAAYVNVDAAEDDGPEAFRVNAIAVRDLARACAECGCDLLTVSTDYVFDGLKTSVPYDEDDLPNPLNVYGMTKYAGEIYIANEMERHYIVRLASLYGVRGASGKDGNFVYNILQKAARGEPLSVVDDIVMSPTFSLDAAHAIWEILQGSGMPYGIYHATNGGCCSWHEFACAILQLSDVGNSDVKAVSHSQYQSKVRRPLWSAMASNKGIRLRHWREALEDFLRLIG